MVGQGSVSAVDDCLLVGCIETNWLMSLSLTRAREGGFTTAGKVVSACRKAWGLPDDEVVVVNSGLPRGDQLGRGATDVCFPLRVREIQG